MRKVLTGRLACEAFVEPDGSKGYRFSGSATYGRLLEPVKPVAMGLLLALVSPTHPGRSREALGEPLLIVGRIPRS